MGKPKHTKKSIIQTLQNLAKRKGSNTLAVADLRGLLPTSSVSYHFGSFGRALSAAGLGIAKDRVYDAFTEDELFSSVRRLESRIGHEPSYSEYQAGGQFSIKPFKVRYGNWDRVLDAYRRWKALHDVPSTEAFEAERSPLDSSDSHAASARRIKGPSKLYGEPINFRGLRHAPTNEQGVVYLFGMVSSELGFIVEAVQQGFPDCEAKYLHDARKKLWAPVRIEFEYRASSFLEHGHPIEGCDIIVCWENDWADCPIKVIELKTETQRLPNAR